MQLVNLVCRLGGSPLHTVFKRDCSPAEVLVLQHIHGEGAVVDIRPTRVDPDKSSRAEYDRLQHKYDRASTFVSSPGDEHKSVMSRLFPGAMKKLPTTLEEIGLGHLMSPASVAAADAGAASSPAPDEGEEAEVFSPEVEAEPEDDEAKEEAPVNDGFAGFNPLDATGQ